MVEDRQLIRQYAAERSEAAFAELVRRHLKMVYGAALRQVHGDTHLAEDVAQTVFADFARKAETLQHRGCIAGWLFVSTRFAAANAVRAEARRRAREQEVLAINEIAPTGNDGWKELRPLIDEALGELGERDREAIVLRYFQSYEFSLVGAALGVSENAARMRVDRALEKLRVVLQKRGLAATGAGLGAALADTSGSVVPAQLAASITSAALAQAGATGVVASPSILTLITMNKLAGTAIGVAILSLAAVVIVGSLTKSEPRNNIAASSNIAKSTPVQPVQPGTAPDAAIAADAFQRAVRGHDAQVRAREAQETNDGRAQWAKMAEDFKKALKAEPGVTKYGANFEAAIPPGQSLFSSGWRTADGKNTLVCVTPQLISDGTHPGQILLASKLLEVPDGILDRSGYGNYKEPPPGGVQPTQLVSVPSDTVNSIIETMTTNGVGDEAVKVVALPRVLSRSGTVADIIIGNQGNIAGHPQLFGTQLDFFPTQLEDGTLVLEMLIQSTVANDGETPPESGQQ